MANWEKEITMSDKGKKWDGEEGFIFMLHPIWVRGMRLIMRTAEKFIGISALYVWEESYTVQIVNKYHPGDCVARHEPDYFVHKNYLYLGR
jgi:hypothetical protein